MEPFARFGALLATDLQEVSHDPACLDGAGWWAVLRRGFVAWSAYWFLRLTGITKRFGPLVANDGITLALARGCRASAFLDGRAYVTPDDVKELAPDVFRHRNLLTYEAEAEEVTPEKVVLRVLERVEVP